MKSYQKHWMCRKCKNIQRRKREKQCSWIIHDTASKTFKSLSNRQAWLQGNKQSAFYSAGLRKTGMGPFWYLQPIVHRVNEKTTTTQEVHASSNPVTLPGLQASAHLHWQLWHLCDLNAKLPHPGWSFGFSVEDSANALPQFLNLNSSNSGYLGWGRRRKQLLGKAIGHSEYVCCTHSLIISRPSVPKPPNFPSLYHSSSSLYG